MVRLRRLKMWSWIVISFLVLATIMIGGCVRISEGTWYFREAPLPEGWPALTPVGEVKVKAYPQYRAAVVRAGDSDQSTMDGQFMTLFKHIQDRDIAMTAPVEMGFAGRDKEPARQAMTSMAFLYRNPTQGKLEVDAGVQVEDLPARTYASIGVRGGYDDAQAARQLKMLDAWLRENAAQWKADGPPRLLGYNSPFVPVFMRYGEVQVPVRKVEEPAEK